MALVNSATEKKNERNMWVKVQKNSTVKIIPLCDFSKESGNEPITVYKQFEFGKSSGFWTLPDTQEPNDPCRILGFTSKEQYIMPVLLYDDENKSWSEPMYYRFPVSVFQSLGVTNQTIKSFALEESEPNVKFRHAIITVTRDDSTANGIPKYSTQWTAQHLSKQKDYRNGKTPLPESNLDIIKGFLPFQVENSDDMDEIRNKIIDRLIEKGEFEVTVNDTKTTILDLMKEKGLLSNSADNEFEMTEEETNE